MSRTEKDFENSLEYWRDLAKMLREELKKVQAERELKLPSEEDIEKAQYMHEFDECATFNNGVFWAIEQIKALNDGEGEK